MMSGENVYEEMKLISVFTQLQYILTFTNLHMPIFIISEIHNTKSHLFHIVFKFENSPFLLILVVHLWIYKFLILSILHWAPSLFRSCKVSLPGCLI